MGVSARARPATIAAAVVVLAVVVAIAAVVIVLTNRDDEATAQPPLPVPITTAPTSAAPRPPCANEVTVFLGTDAEMRDAAEKLRGDTRIRGLTSLTKQEAYEQFRIVFRDRPELLNVTSPDALPASVRVAPAPDVARTTLTEQLRAEFPASQGVQPPPC